MKIRFLILSVLCYSVWAFAQEATYNFVPGTDFSKYHTYKWMTLEGEAHPDQIVDEQIRQSVESQLAAKGLRKVGSDNADLLAGYQIAVHQEKQWNWYGMSGDLRWGGISTTTSSTIKLGTMLLDFYDPAAKQLVWTGRATNLLDPGKRQEKNQSHLDEAMRKLLKNFPPMR